jgi:GT2 family glycosyltransferase
MTKPRLSIILVNHNAAQLTLNCLASIVKRTALPYEIILVDNASSDNISAEVKKLFPQVVVIANGTNKGFAYANNQAIRLAAGDYVVLLNNDTVLKNNALDKLADFLDKDWESGAGTGKIFEADGSTIQRNCRAFPTPLGTMFGRASFLTRLLPNNPWSRKNLLSDWDYGSAREIDWASGALLMVRREVIERVGLLDDKNFFIYWEDTDWCKRIHAAGWRIKFIPEAEIIHLTGGGGGKRSLFLSNYLTYQMHRSAYYYFRKHYYKSPFHPMAILTFTGMVTLVLFKGLNEIVKQLIAPAKL